MSHTVIGIFEYTNEAQEAKSYLLANGFSNENVDINTSGSYGEGTTTKTTSEGSEEGYGDRISNFFGNLFESDHDASVHTEAARKGTIVTVHAKDSKSAQEALEILDNYGAVDVNEYSEGSKGTTHGNNAIPVIEEELQVGKREVETGGVRLRSRIVERPVEESIRLREERVSVERNPVSRVATEADFEGFKEGTVELKEYAERPVVAKEARVVEEVSLEKETTERNETISDTVRHTEVDTEKIPGTEKTTRYEGGKTSENL